MLRVFREMLLSVMSDHSILNHEPITPDNSKQKAHVKMQLSASNYSISAEVYRTHFSGYHAPFCISLTSALWGGRQPALYGRQQYTRRPLHYSCKTTCTLDSTHKHCNYVQALGSVWRFFDKQVTVDQPPFLKRVVYRWRTLPAIKPPL